MDQAVNFSVFLDKIRPFCKSKEDDILNCKGGRSAFLKTERIAMEQAVFKLLCIGGQNNITVIDLQELTTYFDTNTKLGTEMHKLLDLY